MNVQNKITFFKSFDFLTVRYIWALFLGLVTLENQDLGIDSIFFL